MSVVEPELHSFFDGSGSKVGVQHRKNTGITDVTNCNSFLPVLFAFTFKQSTGKSSKIKRINGPTRDNFFFI
jgi:hypothetical protein